jgi:hypothetical protein
MENMSTEHHYPYAYEVIGEIEPIEEDFIRGSKFVDALSLQNEALEGVEYWRDNYFINFRQALMVVHPQSPVRRTVKRADDFYPWTVRPETTESSDLLIIEGVEILSPSSEEGIQGFVRGHSPSYKYNYGGDVKPLIEIYTFDPTKHRIAIHIQ